MTIKPGTLVYDKESGRYDIRSGLNEYYGGLHCGQSFEVFDGKHWKPTRIEMDSAGTGIWWVSTPTI